MSVSPQRRREIIDALRRGTVPERSLDTFAVGLDRLAPTFDDELSTVRRGGAVFKAIRGEYGSGKTFCARWLEERAKAQGFATSEVQIAESETPLHHLEAVYRRLCERLSTSDVQRGALRSVIDGWFFALEQDVLAEGTVDERDTAALLERTSVLMERRLEAVTRSAPSFTTALRAYRQAVADGNAAVAEGVLAWMAAQPNVGAEVKRFAKVKGDIDHMGALSFLQGLLVILRDAGHAGLLLALDEVETLQRVRSDIRDRALNALRQLVDEVDSGRFPGLYLVVTGTPAFFDGPQGIQRLAPLAQRLHVDWSGDPRFDNPRAVQVRLPGFSQELLEAVGRRVRDLYVEHSRNAERIRARVDDAYVADLGRAVAGDFGGRVGVAPRVFLKKLVADVLDRVDQFDDFDPRQHYKLTISDTELTDAEQRFRGAAKPDDIELKW